MSADRNDPQITGAARSLPQTVLGQLRRLITEGELQPGAKLNERQLCERLGVSRTPLREAIRMLAAERLVELIPNRGAIVARLTLEEIVHHFEVIADLEALSGELACTRITEAELAEIQALHFEMLACHARHDLQGYYRMNAEIHNRINAAAANPVLEKVYHQINHRLQALRFRSNFNRRKWDQAVAEHGEMVEALRARDGQRMREVMLRHVGNKRDVVLAELEAGKP